MRLMIVPVIGTVLVAAACGAETDEGVGAVPPPGTTEITAPPTSPPTTPPTTAPPTAPPTPPAELRYDPEVARTELAAARARWAEHGWQSYRFTYTPTCFCPRDQVDAHVMGGRVVNDDGEGRVRSIEDWFDEIEAAIGTAVDIRVRYDDWGYPTSLYIDVDERMADEEFGFEFVGFADVTDAIDRFMTDEYGCGFGFWVATDDQTASFLVDFVGITDFEAGPPPGAYDLADQSASIRFGTDLMANWCDDVMEEGEPEADVVDTWKIVAGTLDLAIDDRTATATMRGVVAVTADGAEVPLGDVTITNTMWGFFAG